MNTEHAELYRRIADFSIDEPGVRLPFTARLARENGWDRDYTLRVVEEYKKFIFLAVVAGHPVTPSEQVDQAWHLHLVYTRSYWEDFCGTVLGQPVHHGPTKGGHEEQAKYRDWYERTKESYRHLFGDEPPADIWPDGETRFGEDLHYRRVNTKRNWVLAKGPLRCIVQMCGVLSLLMLVLFVGERSWLDHGGGDVFVAGNFLDFFIDHPWIGVIVIVIVLSAFAETGAGRCPKCGKAAAMDKTGKEEDGRQEWQCAYCKHKEWRDEAASVVWGGNWFLGDGGSDGDGDGDGGDGGGCGGGCGGCGGCG